MNFKYRMHLCFSFTEPAAAIQNSRSHHRRGDVTSQPPSYSLGETANSGKHLPYASHQEGVL